MVLGGYHIPSGTAVVAQAQVIQNNPKYWREPDEFLPERWLKGHPDYEKNIPHANLPFRHGPRICIGMRFATAEILVLAVKMLQQFRITYDGPPAEAETDHVAAVKLKLDVAVKLIDRI